MITILPRQVTILPWQETISPCQVSVSPQLVTILPWQVTILMQQDVKKCCYMSYALWYKRVPLLEQLLKSRMLLCL